MTKSAKRSSTAKEKEPAKRAARQSTKSRSVAEMFAQQKGKRATSSRRNQDEVSSEEEEEGSDSNASDSEQSDSEVEISSNKRRKTAKSLEKRGGTQSTRKQRKKKSTTSPTEVSITHESQLLEQIPSEQNETLYDQVSAPDAEIEEIVAVWVERYRRDKGDALRNLVNFIIRGCGCMNAVTKDAFHRDDIAIAVLEELQEELAKFPQPEYPVISKSKTGKILKRNILNFFAYMVEVCQHDIIYDGSFIETLQNWLTTISVYRPFRHTATILTFRVVKSLCTFADKVNKELQVVTQQLKTENERQTNRARNTQKKRMLEQRSQTLNRKKTNLEEYLNDFFEGVFIHRSRDVESVIRAECIKELCLWTQQYSAHYTNNIYLRHFGWSLNDSNASVRSEALKSISRLYQIEKVVSCLNDFTKRFKRRIEEIALYDIDLSVRLHGIELCYVLFRHDHEMISDECRNELMSLVFLDNERLQKTVAPLVKTVMEAKVLDPMMEETEKALGAMNVDGASTTVAATSTVEKTWISFKCLATFLAERIADEKAKSDSTIDSLNDSLNTTTAAVLDEENGDQLVANAIEALWNQMPMLQDYESLAQYLTRDHSSSHQQDEEELATAGPAAPTPVEECYRLSEEEEAVLIKVFATSLKLITERGFEQVDGKTKDKKKACDEAQLESNRSTISRYLVQVLPRLLTKHSDSTSKMLKLISIPQLMNINVYAELRMQTEYEELLQIVIKVYIGTTLPELLQNCAESLHHMFKVDLLADVNERQFPELMERVTAQVRDACRGKDIATARFDDDDIHATTTSLLRLDYLINFIDVTDMMEESEDMDEDVTELVGHFVDRASYGYKIEKQSSLSAMAILFRYLVWKCERVSVDPELKEVGRAALGKIERRRDWVFEKFTGIVTMTDITPLAAVKSNAFGILMDLYWIFSSDLFATNGLDLLLLSCSENIQKECENYIVSELEKWQEALEKKKNKEAEDDDEVDELEGDNEDDQVEYSGIDLVANVARAVTAKVLDYKYMVPIAAEYGHLEPDADDIIKAFIEETKKDLIGNDSQTDEVCHMYIGILKKAFESHVNQAPRSIDKSVSFARLISQTLHIADQEDPARHVAPHVICDSIHIDGINFALEKAAEHKSHRNRADMGVALKFFKVLSVLVKPLNRARDVAKIHKHIEKCLEELDLTVEPNDKEWDAYHTYIKDIDMILRKKGLRYDNQHVQQQAQQQQ
ncbi:hypothetical protein BDA99DRAFT_560837 [Phascolomyces articulosus]|uniref:SCD domain-containing protein n=1 Tax=Phascolomyces articulosus TaxID=60185 RepID=A0AAD5JXI5_9FUNG|nr:hypothetical protein BDA99DRAFT_560837 [Phascolomyces articulosus]